EWETRLTSVDNNRVVRPLDWGVEWARGWPCRNGHPDGYVPDDCQEFLSEYNRRIVATSDEFYSYQKPIDYCLERRQVRVFSTREVPDPALEKKVRGTYADFLRFTSPVRTPYPENNRVNARWFPTRGKRAVEFRCRGLHGFVPCIEFARDFGVTVEYAVSRHSNARGDQACRLRGVG